MSFNMPHNSLTKSLCYYIPHPFLYKEEWPIKLVLGMKDFFCIRPHCQIPTAQTCLY